MAASEMYAERRDQKFVKQEFKECQKMLNEFTKVESALFDSLRAAQQEHEK